MVHAKGGTVLAVYHYWFISFDRTGCLSAKDMVHAKGGTVLAVYHYWFISVDRTEVSLCKRYGSC